MRYRLPSCSISRTGRCIASRSIRSSYAQLTTNDSPPKSHSELFQSPSLSGRGRGRVEAFRDVSPLTLPSPLRASGERGFQDAFDPRRDGRNLKPDLESLGMFTVPSCCFATPTTSCRCHPKTGANTCVMLFQGGVGGGSKRSATFHPSPCPLRWVAQTTCCLGSRRDKRNLKPDLESLGMFTVPSCCFATPTTSCRCHPKTGAALRFTPHPALSPPGERGFQMRSTATFHPSPCPLPSRGEGF